MKCKACSYILVTILLAYAPDLHAQEPKNNNELFDKASAYFFKKNFDAARPLLQRIIEEDPGNFLAYTYLGDIYLLKKRYDEALDQYKKSIEINPASGTNYFRMGQVYYHKKNGLQAVRYFKKAIDTDKRLKFAYYHIGLTYLMLLRDKENTIENWEKFLEIAPDDPQYEKIKRVIALLKNPNFVIPPLDSDISIEEALLLGGLNIDRVTHKSTDKEEGHEGKKTKRKLEGLYLDDAL
jgi:tetratricopeptide (TPR) repeat protein